jgi:predicted ATP-dependent serine protease
MRFATTLHPQRIVGREIELEALDRYVSDVSAWPSALIVEGTAGIGKSTLLDAAVAAARERSYTVLRCGPGVHESRLSFAELRELLEDVYEVTAAGSSASPARSRSGARASTT